jgi:hypothetical protein
MTARNLDPVESSLGHSLHAVAHGGANVGRRIASG